MVTIGALATLIIIRLADAVGLAPSIGVRPVYLVFGVLGVPTVAVLVAWAAALRCAGRLDRSGDPRAVGRARGVLFVARASILAAHAAAVLAMGWPALVRAVIGDLPLVDELVAATPTLFGLIGTVAAWHPVELRLREARIFADLELGGAVHPPPTLGAHVARAVRLQIGTLLVPLCLLLAASESVELLLIAASGPAGAGLPGWFRDPAALAWVSPAAQFGAAGVVLVFAPVVVRAVWDAPALGPGPLRDSLEGVLRAHGVGVRDIVVWRTGGTVINAAVLGVFPSLRYLALSDGLLDTLPESELEAITAHEAAHLRYRHIPWLAAAVVAAVLFLGGAGGVLLAMVRFEGESPSLVAAAVTIVAGLVALGAVSRRFEWQADAFAAAHGSGDSASITREGAGPMVAALSRVASLNGVEPGRFDWRHGSIRERQRRLRAVIGVDRSTLPQDREVRSMLTLLGVLAVLGAALVWVEAVLVSSPV